MEIYTGTIVNVFAILIGGIIGLAVGSKIKKNYHETTVHCLGIFTVALGVKMALEMDNFLLVVCALISGSMLGEWIGIEKRLELFGAFLKKKTSRIKGDNKKFVDAFVTTSLVFCIGSMAILGSIESGIKNDHSILFAKSVMDGIFTLTYSSTFGVGALFSFLPVLIYQGLITFGASAISGWMTDPVIAAMSASGGLMILGLGLNILKITQIRIGNMLPAILIAGVLAGLFP